MKNLQAKTADYLVKKMQKAVTALDINQADWQLFCFFKGQTWPSLFFYNRATILFFSTGTRTSYYQKHAFLSTAQPAHDVYRRPHAG